MSFKSLLACENSFLLIALIAININVLAQPTNSNWYDAPKSAEEPFNISTDLVYEKLIKQKKGHPVVVAVIDSGVDIDHEDLKNVIWTNNDEIPDNGIDDDKNGYIDDVHGWNFIGGKDGAQVGPDSYESTRLYGELKKKYEFADPTKLSKKELNEYNTYNRFAKSIESQAAGARKNYEEILSMEFLYKDIIDYVRENYDNSEITENAVDSMGMSLERNGMIAANVFRALSQQLGYIPSIDEMSDILLSELKEPKAYFGNRWKYGFNPNFDSRKIVGDDYMDLTNRIYGNNAVKGPDPMHGTHVSGIIAAQRDNNIGINGIAENVKIMVLRAVPDGDERDKDIGNAIRYAVENGASVINMSFGKGQSPQKQYVDDAVRFAEKNDVLIIHASGNSGMNIDEGDNDYYNDDVDKENFPNDMYLKPKGFLFWKKKKANNWISVGASSRFNSEEIVASFSNYGQENVDVFAPGEFMLSTTPDNTYQIQQGTSMAAPVVAGIAALLRSYFPTLTAKQVREVIIESTTPLDMMVTKPGTEELVPFSSLCASGGIVDIKSAFILASTIKGKKKIKRAKNIQA
jgi:subtilisin family serine protease